VGIAGNFGQTGNNISIAPGGGAVHIYGGSNSTWEFIGTNSSAQVEIGLGGQMVATIDRKPVSAVGGSITITAGCGGAGSSVTSGSSDNRGQFTTANAASTTCTITFGTAFATAPFCVFGDGNASVTPVAYSAGATSTTTAVVDFASVSNAKINYVCF
jgi:hypothetical protein